MLNCCFMGLFVSLAPKAGGILAAQNRDWTCTLCIERQSLNHWTAREMPRNFLKIIFKFNYYKNKQRNCPYLTVIIQWFVCVHAKSFQSCPALCDSMDCGPPGSSVHGILQTKNTGVGCHILLQGIFLTQGLHLYLLGPLHWQASSLPLAPPAEPYSMDTQVIDGWI